jgi:hypothetical protein
MSTKAKIFVALGVTAAFVVGMGAGAAAGPADDTAATIHSPTTTVTQTAQMQTRTPQSCLDALDAAEAVGSDVYKFDQILVDNQRLMRPAIMAAYKHDAAEMTRITSQVQSINTRIQSINGETSADVAAFNTAKTACRSSAS